MRHAAHARLCQLRRDERADGEVLRRVRLRARGGSGAGHQQLGGAGPGLRAPARVRPVRRPRRLHSAFGDARLRGGAGASDPLLRHVQPVDRALRRHGREVHRRRGDGRLGHADRHRGRRRARSARSARPRRRRVGPGRRSRCARAARAGRRPHRGGGGDNGRGAPGYGRRRPRQHGVAGAVGRGSGRGVRGRVDAQGNRADGRLRRGRGVRAEGQGRPPTVVAGSAGRARAARSSRQAWKRPSSAATANCARSKTSSTPVPTSARRI